MFLFTLVCIAIAGLLVGSTLAAMSRDNAGKAPARALAPARPPQSLEF